jgi:nucleotide-binding universal stress UspA family protein
MLEKVLVGVDGRSGGRDAIALARELADPHGRLVLAKVYDGGKFGGGGGLAVAVEREAAQSMLTRERQAASIEAKTVICFSGDPGKALGEIARQERADLLVVGSSHRGRIGRVLLGDDTIVALTAAPCPVAIAPSGYGAGEHRLATLGVGYDESVESETALRVARMVAAGHGSKIRLRAVVTRHDVSPEPPEPLDFTAATDRVIGETRARLATIQDVDADVVYGDPGESLAALAHDVDLMVVGSRGQGPLGRMMSGSTSMYLARRVSCPLLAVPRRVSEPEPTAPDEPSRRPRALEVPAY